MNSGSVPLGTNFADIQASVRDSVVYSYGANVPSEYRPNPLFGRNENGELVQWNVDDDITESPSNKIAFNQFMATHEVTETAPSSGTYLIVPAFSGIHIVCGGASRPTLVLSGSEPSSKYGLMDYVHQPGKIIRISNRSTMRTNVKFSTFRSKEKTISVSTGCSVRFVSDGVFWIPENTAL